MANEAQAQYEAAREQLQQYRAGNVGRSAYFSMILRWGKAGLLEARPYIEPFLYDADASLRDIALEALACQFCLQDYWPIAVNFLLYDPEYRVRSVGADALASLQSKTQDQRTLGILASVVYDSYEEMLIRRDAYRSMRVVAYGDWKALSGPNDQPYELDRDADWNFIHASMDREQETVRKEEAQLLLVHYQSGHVAEPDFYAMLRKFARARLQESHEAVEGFLSSPSKLLRETALSTLVLYLQVPGNWQMAVDLLEHDLDIEMRLKGAELLGLLMKNTRDKKTLRVLQSYLNDDDLAISLGAIEAIDKIYPGDFGDFLAYMAESQ